MDEIDRLMRMAGLYDNDDAHAVSYECYGCLHFTWLVLVLISLIYTNTYLINPISNRQFSDVAI
jgi:hypothetical protein